ncbi:SDR family oxidoreductase [Geomonas anaerohicana]|uniref:SDR family oxidoreductase n=1 Tax=Geomonas anaerohicana TaxID=2798583 RepID=A0ABS0YBW1_9BACT|nr:SDR family oxidoreductase [Geomonas anaerohicana]MBJ6749786.1 SDR family oxidoreductase [Geomonas anaerohicana]
MDVAGKVVLVTGANGGIGWALVQELLERGAAKVYAAARNVQAVAEMAKFEPGRVIALRVDVTHETSVASAAAQCQDVDLLINNAGVNQCQSLLAADGLDSARQEIKVNYLGTLSMCRAFAPILTARGGAIANVCSILGLVNLPVNGTYSASKAAGHSLLQGVRAELASRGVKVYGVYPGPVDTRMTAGQEMAKATPGQVATMILDGIARDEEYIFPDAMSQDVHRALLHAPDEVERQFSAMLP